DARRDAWGLFRILTEVSDGAPLTAGVPTRGWHEWPPTPPSPLSRATASASRCRRRSSGACTSPQVGRLTTRGSPPGRLGAFFPCAYQTALSICLLPSPDCKEP